MAKIVIFGTGDLAELAHYYFTADTGNEVVAFTVDGEYIKEETFRGLPVVAFEAVEKTYPVQTHEMFIGIGYTRVNKARAEKYHQAKAKGYGLASYISSKATIFDNVQIGDNCFLLEGTIVQPFATIGNNVIIWSGSHVGHHSEIGDHCFLAPHAVISGRVRVEPFCFIGLNATVRDHVTIARECIIGAGALILHSTVERGVYKGTSAAPAKVDSSEIRI